jgi:hypothetical protein
MVVSASAFAPSWKGSFEWLRSAAQYEQKRESIGIIRAQLGHLISELTLRTVGLDALDTDCCADTCTRAEPADMLAGNASGGVECVA